MACTKIFYVRGQVYLGGGGSAQDEALLWDEFLQSGQRIVYWPFALPSDSHEAAYRWLVESLTTRGRFDVQMWSTVRGRSSSDLHVADVLFIGGGNTFDLLDQLQRHQFLLPVQDFVAGGGAVYGGSAGAILTGADVAIAEKTDPQHPDLSNTVGLDLLGGLVVHPHFVSAHVDELRSWASEHTQRVLAIPERSGVAVTNGIARVVGHENVYLFDGVSQQRCPPGQSWEIVT